MRTLVFATALVAPLALAGCDTGQAPVVDESKQSKKPGELKQAKKAEMTPEELAEARKKAGFVDPEEQMAEARKKLEREDKMFVKGHLDDFRKITKDLGEALDSVEKGAPKWAKAKDSDAAFNKFNEGYKKDNKELMKAYREMTSNGANGVGSIKLNGFITDFENFNGDLSGKISENEKFATSLEALRKALTDVNTAIDEIEKDESIEPVGTSDDAAEKK